MFVYKAFRQDYIKILFIKKDIFCMSYQVKLTGSILISGPCPEIAQFYIQIGLEVALGAALQNRDSC